MNKLVSILNKYIHLIHGNYMYYHFKRLYEKDPKLAAYALYDRIYGNHDDFNIDDPKTLIEKITWMELHTDTSMWTLCADKYRVREYIAQCGLSDFLPKLYGHWDDPETIDFSQLPNQFVLKANNGCGTVMVVKDKKTLDEIQVKKTLKKWVSRLFGYMGAQSHYLSIKPCIIAEELLQQEPSHAAFSPHSLVDFKVWCINGMPESVLVTYNRHKGKHDLDLYDLSWKRKKDCINFNGSFGYSEQPLPKPKSLDKMLEMAQILSKGFPEMRVDFYEVDGRPVIGELTLSAGYGNLTKEYYEYLGGKIDLKKMEKVK